MNLQVNFRVTKELLTSFRKWANRYTDGDLGTWLGLCHRLVAEAGGPKLTAMVAGATAARKRKAKKGRQ
jgi:hypothetical protein